MTNKTKSTTRKHKVSRKEIATSIRSGSLKFKVYDWLILPLVCFIAFNTYYLWNSSLKDILWLPLNTELLLVFLNLEFSLFLATIFAATYTYKAIRRIITGESIHIFPRIVACIFTALFLWFVLASGDDGRTCTGFMGAQTSCSNNYVFMYYLYILNPISLLVWNVLAIAGTITLLLKSKSGRSKSIKS